MDFGAGGLEFSGVEDVVVVLVGEQHVVDFDMLGFEPIGHTFWGVDEDIALRGGKQVTVGLGEAAGEMRNFDHVC